jgi:hypothetical protein
MQLVQPSNAKLLNAAARALLDAHVRKPVSNAWRYSNRVAVETICKTFPVSPVESAAALQKLITPERLAEFPHDDLFDLAQYIKFLGPAGDEIVLRLFEAAFGTEPKPGEWEQFGSAIMPMRIQSSDQWNSIHYSLAGYYESLSGENAKLVTDIACIAWNAVVRRREERRSIKKQILGAMEFRHVRCDLLEDYSHIWGRDFENEENRILSHFEQLLRKWATEGDVGRLNAALDALARRNRTSLMWTVFMEVAAEHPLLLGRQLECLLSEPLFLYHPDYAYGGTALLGALHKSGDIELRERLERLILNLPSKLQSRRPDSWEDGQPSSWVQHAQNRLLGSLQETHIVCAEVKALWQKRRANDQLVSNAKPSLQVRSHTYSEEEILERRGVSFKEPANKHLLKLRDALRPFIGQDSSAFNVKEIERHWSLIARCEAAVKRYRKRCPEMAEEVWGYLVRVAENIARYAEWPNHSPRWIDVRRILLKAANDPIPGPDKPGSQHDSCSAWGWPAPRIDAAQGIALLVSHLPIAEAPVTAAIKALSRDKAGPVRFNLARVLPILEKTDPELMWQLIDAFVAEETHFTVLDAVVHSLSCLSRRHFDKVIERLNLISSRAKSAPAEHMIHETLAHAYLFEFLHSGRCDCKEYIAKLIEHCVRKRDAKALIGQLHPCRKGGWMTAGDGVQDSADLNEKRSRTWTFLLDLLGSAQSKLKAHRKHWIELQKTNAGDTSEAKDLQIEIQRLAQIIDGIGMELFFASGAFAEKQNNPEDKLSDTQKCRFWREAFPLLSALADEPHPHIAYQLVETLQHLLPCDPQQVFLLAATAIRTSSTAGFQHESLAVTEVVRLVQRVLADHREIFRSTNGEESASLVALLDVLDLFVEAGWPEARELTHRLEEIYR